MSKVPEIRFEGFDGEWEEKKLGEIAEFNPKCNLPDKFEYVDLESVVGTEMISHRTEIKKDAPSRAQRLAKRGDIFYQMVRPYQKNNYLFDLPYHDYVFSTGYAQLRPLVDNQFLMALLQDDRFVTIVLDHCTGTSYPAINSKDLASITVYFPLDKQEQYQIGSYFQTLDALLTSHQHRLTQLQTLKKYMLQKMFPKKGEKVPEIRFEGFDGKWEEKKLGEISSRVQGNDGRMDLPTLTISAANGWMKQEDRFSGNIAGKEQKNYTLLHQGELSYNHGNSKLAKFGTVFTLNTYEEALVPRVYHSFRIDNGDADFIEYYFATKIPDNELRKLISSGARMDGLLNINFDEFMSIKMYIPTVEEQIKISSFFRSLDDVITTEQTKLDTLKTLKKYFLQKMFPKKG